MRKSNRETEMTQQNKRHASPTRPLDPLDADPPDPFDTSKTGNDPSPKRIRSRIGQYWSKILSGLEKNRVFC
jgi:hypothetical protein